MPADLELATLWVPVSPSTAGLEAKFHEVGEIGRKGFQAGFSGGSGGGDLFAGLTQHAPSGEEHGRTYGAQFSQGLAQGLERADVGKSFEPVMNAISSKQLLMVSGVAAAVTAGVELITKGVEAYVEVFEKGFETVIDLTKELGEEFEHISDQLTLFSNNPALTGDAQRVLMNLDAPAGQLGNTLAVLNDRLGLTGAGLDTMASHVEVLRDRLGSLDVDTLTQGLLNMGVASEDDDKMLNLLFQTQTKYGVDLNVITGQIAKESDALTDLGLSYAQSADMLGMLDEKDRRAADGIAGMTATAGKGADKLHESVQKFVADELAMINSYEKAGRTDLADQEARLAFGARRAQTAKDFAEAYLNEMSKSPAEIAANEQAIDNADQATRHWQQSVEEFHNKLMATFGPAAAAILEEFTGELDTVGDWFTDHSPEIVDTVKSWGDAFIQMLPDIREALVTGGRLFVDFGAVAVAALEPVTLLLSSAAASVLLLTGHLREATDLMKTASNLPSLALGAATSGNDALDKLENLPIDPGAIQQHFDQGLDKARNTGPSLPGPDSTGIQDKAKKANKSPQQYIDDEKGLVARYHSEGRDDLAEAEAQSAFGMSWKDVLKPPPPAPPPSALGPTGGGNFPTDQLPGGLGPAGGGSTGGTTGGGGDGGAGGVHTSGYYIAEPINNAPKVVLVSTHDPLPVGHDPHTDRPRAPGNEPHTRDRGGGGGARTQDEEREIRDRQDRVDNANDSLDDANQRVTDAKSKEAEKQQTLTAAQQQASDKGLIPGSEEYVKRQAALQKATDEHTAAEREVTKALHGQKQATEHLADAQDDASKPLKEDKTSSKEEGGGGNAAAEGLGSSLLSGMMSDLGLGNVFGGKSPLQFGAAKMGLGALNWALGAFGHQGAGGSGGSAGAMGEHVTGPYMQQRGEHVTAPGQPAQPGQPGVAEPNVTHPGWGMGPQPQIAPGVTMAGYHRANYPMGGTAGSSGAVTTAAINQPTQPSQPATSGGGPTQLASYIQQRGQQLGLTPTEIGMALAVQKHEGTGPTGNPSMGFGPEAKAAGMNFDNNPNAAVDQYLTQYTSRLPAGLDRNDPNAVADYIWHTVHHASDPNYGQGLLGAYHGAVTGGGPSQSAQPVMNTSAGPMTLAAGSTSSGGWEVNPGAKDTATSGLARYGAIPGAASGAGQNIVGWMEQQVAQYNQATGSNLSITATYPGGPHGGHPDDGGDHSANRAIDIGGSPEQMSAFANYWDSRPDLVAATRQLIHQGPGFADSSNVFGGHLASGQGIYGAGTMAEHANHDHLAMENIPGFGDPGNVNQMQPRQPQNPTNAPVVQPQSPANKAQQGAMGALSGLLSGLVADGDPRSYQGILTQPPPRAGAVHYDNSIHLSGTSTANPNELMQAVQEKQNSRFMGITGGMPQGGVGSP
jgi:hypothetical protein